MKLIAEKTRYESIPPKPDSYYWLRHMASLNRSGNPSQGDSENILLDPQHGWYARNMLICEFLQSVPPHRQMRLIGEELLAEPDDALPKIASWLGLRTDFSAIEEMKHPERSPYAFLGPPGARYGNDGHFLKSPSLKERVAIRQHLEGPLGWRNDHEGFSPEVKVLARSFGYT
jgi:hypothetical protein